MSVPIYPRPPRLLVIASCAALLGISACVGDDAAQDSETGTSGPSSESQASSNAASTGPSSGTTDTSSTASTSSTSVGTQATLEPTSESGESTLCADLPLCDGFEGMDEGGPPDADLWSVVSPNCSGAGSLAIDHEISFRGDASLRIDGAGGYCDHIFIANEDAIAEIAGPEVYGRFYLRLEDPLGGGHVTFMTLRDEADGPRDLRMGGQSEILMWNRESDDATLPALSPVGIEMSLRPAAASWVCVEFMIDGPLGALQTWIDGAQVPGLVVDAEPTPDVDQQWNQKPDWNPELSDFKLGWESYAGQSMTLRLDEVALGGERIGCL